MTGNPLPWLVLASIVAGSLVYKGYLKLPSSPQEVGITPIPTAIAQAGAGPVPGVDIDALVKLGSGVLGLAFAKAKRLEAEEGLARRIAEDAGTAIEATFTAPFSVPAPAGPGSPPVNP